MTLIEKLKAKGVKVYGDGTPLWEKVEELGTVVLSENCVLAEDRYGKKQLVMQEGTKTVYIPLKSGTPADKDSYSLVLYAATKDWEEYSISAGDTRVFAV